MFAKQVFKVIFNNHWSAAQSKSIWKKIDLSQLEILWLGADVLKPKLVFPWKKIQPVWVKILHRMWYCNSPVCHFFKFTHEKFSHSTKATTLNLLLPCFFFTILSNS